MKNKLNIKRKLWLSIFTLVAFLFFINTYVFNNFWMLITDSANHIPENSSIFTFRPTEIDSGSGGYWRYGEDSDNYYYFSVQEENVYLYASKKQNCEGLDGGNYLTWCEKIKVNYKK